MGRDRGRRWRRDDDDDDAPRGEDARLRAARKRYEAETRALRDQERRRRGRLAKLEWAWRFGALGAGLLAMGLAMQPFGGLAATGTGILMAALVGWLGSVVNQRVAARIDREEATPVAQRPEITAPAVEGQGLPSGRAELVQGVLAEAATALRQMDAQLPRLRHPDGVASVAHIVAVGNRLMAQVAAQPEKLSIAQRVFTYYCPEAVRVTEALARLEAGAPPDVERIAGTQSVLKKLEVLFDSTEIEMRAGEAKALDIDLKLLDQSIEADLKTR